MRPWTWMLAPALVVLPPGQQSLEEYQALAKVLRHFIALVGWPGATEGPLRICVLGGAGFGADLDLALGRTTVAGRKVQLRYLSASAFINEPLECDVLFVDRGEEGRLPAVLAKTQGKPVLTLGYGDGLAKKGLMGRFYLEGNRIRFEVNATKVKEAGLSISSHLLSIAKIVDA